jgi:hypothetical protein
MWTIALVLNVIHLAYHQVTTHVDFFPFNNVRHYKRSERIAEVAVNGLTMGFPVVALLSRDHKLIACSCVVLGFLLVGEFLTWWPAYFLGTPGWMKKWKEVYDRTHKHTIQCLPPIKDHPAPNLEHCVLFALSLAAFAATLRYCLGR